MNSFDLNKPILKWVGGKRRILEDLLSKFPTEMNAYHELFVGGGSVLIGVLLKQKKGMLKIKQNKVYAYDSNETLIHMYKNIQKEGQCKILYDKANELNHMFLSLPNSIVRNLNPLTLSEAMTSRESYYYWIRKRFNTMTSKERTTPLGSALFIFLNKTCFRGLYRLGPNGFNVGYGHNVNPVIIHKANLKTISELIRNVHFHCLDFKESIDRVKQGEFVYLDPPYFPIKPYSFVHYSMEGFTANEHEILFDLLKKKGVGCPFVMSNSEVAHVLEAFPDDDYDLSRLLCRRSIRSMHVDSSVNEVIIRNY